MEDQVVLVKKNGRWTYQRIVNGVAVVLAPVALTATAHAEGLDMTQGTTQLALALAAIGALGAAKLAPAALTWVWFLSRLCGGEEEFYPKKSSYSKAYQVKIPFLPYIFCLDITD